MASWSSNHSLPSSDNDTMAELSPVSNDISTAVGALILGVVFLLGVPGNLFVAWSIMARARHRSVTTLLIFNLACADGFLMALTVFFVVYLATQTWVFGRVMCKVLFYLCNVNMYASIFLITLMSLHRLVAVVWPLKLSSVACRKIVTRMVAGMWASVTLIALPSLIFREVIKKHDDEQDTILVCTPKHDLPREVMFQYSFETVVGFIIPYAVIMTSYIKIVRRLKQTKFRRTVRSEKLIMGIVVTFGLLWLPYHVINMVQVSAEWFGEKSKVRAKLLLISETSRAVTSALAFISSCANPVLYTFAGKAYIKKNGFSFMARLFEGTSMDQTANKIASSTKKSTEL
ncbi:unnamed protein product [Arctogadus glacialis]